MSLMRPNGRKCFLCFSDRQCYYSPFDPAPALPGVKRRHSALSGTEALRQTGLQGTAQTSHIPEKLVAAF